MFIAARQPRGLLVPKKHLRGAKHHPGSSNRLLQIHSHRFLNKYSALFCFTKIVLRLTRAQNFGEEAILKISHQTWW
jgi:hypothetical protein